MNLHNESDHHNSTPATPNLPPLTIAQIALQIANLPSAPTFDWTTQAAKSLAQLNLDASFGVIIAQHDHGSNRLSTESTGVFIPPLQQLSSEHQARCPLDRLGSSVFNLTPTQRDSGCVSPASTLFPKWALSPTSDPWTAKPPFQTLAGYAPIKLSNAHTATPSHALLILACPSPSSTHACDPTALATALAAMAHKASDAICCDTAGTTIWLTQREQVILNHLIVGQSVRAIAESIGRSPHTVHDHVKNLHRKLNASSRGQLIANALGHNGQLEPITLINPIIDPSLIQQPKISTTVTELKPATSPRQAVPLTQPTIAH